MGPWMKWGGSSDRPEKAQPRIQRQRVSRWGEYSKASKGSGPDDQRQAQGSRDKCQVINRTGSVTCSWEAQQTTVRTSAGNTRLGLQPFLMGVYGVGLCTPTQCRSIRGWTNKHTHTESLITTHWAFLTRLARPFPLHFQN